LISWSEAARRIRRVFNLERTVTIVVVAIVSWQLFLPPVLGMADNGDFARLLVFFDLTHSPTDKADRYFGFFTRHYVVDAAEAKKYSPPGFISSELVFMAGPVGINRPLGRATFDLLELGVVHVAVFAVCTFFLLYASRPFAGPVRTAAVILGLIVFTDIAYIAYFNSFYSESATFLFFIIVAACAYGAISSGRHRIAWLVAYFAAVSAFLLAKYQNIVLLPIFLFFGGLLVKRWDERRYFRAYLVFSLVACYGGYQFYISSPDVISDAVLYNSVFSGILVDSPTPQDDLSALGLDRGYAKFAGSTAFEPESLRFNPEFLRKFRETVNVGALFRFYLTRPARLLGALNRTVGYAFQLRPALGNYERSLGYPPLAISRSWAMWSSLRSAVLPRNLGVVVAIAILYLALLSRRWLRDQSRLARLNLEWSALIAIMAFAQLVVIAISDGILDLTKHAYLFNLLFDSMLVTMAALLLASLAGSQRKETVVKAEGAPSR
jgi:hypothetical protein